MPNKKNNGSINAWLRTDYMYIKTEVRNDSSFAAVRSFFCNENAHCAGGRIINSCRHPIYLTTSRIALAGVVGWIIIMAFVMERWSMRKFHEHYSTYSKARKTSPASELESLA